MVLGLKPMGKPTILEKTKVLDRSRALYGSRTQAYGETNYLRINKGFRLNQGIVWSSDSSLWGNQLPERKNRGFRQNQGIVWSSDWSLWRNQRLEKKKTKFFDRTMVLYGPRSPAYGETNYLRKNKGFGQNHGIVWFSDSSLWGSQLPERKAKV